MTRAQAIKKKCFECAGDSNKEVTLCHIVDCPLWEFRTGDHISSKRHQARIAIAKRKYTQEFLEVEKLGVSTEKY